MLQTIPFRDATWMERDDSFTPFFILPGNSADLSPESKAVLGPGPRRWLAVGQRIGVQAVRERLIPESRNRVCGRDFL